MCSLAREHWAAGRADAAIGEAWTAYRLEPQDTEAKLLLAALVGEFPAQIAPGMRGDLLQLLADREVAPEYISVAGWLLLLRDGSWFAAAKNAAFDSLAARLEGDELTLALLREAPVFLRDAERVLTQLRRWLLLSRQWSHYRRLADALIVQAGLNGGAWPFSDTERELLKPASTLQIAAAYRPVPAAAPAPRASEFADPVTRAVAEDYERWPYPVWRRIMAVETRQRLPDQIRRLDPDGPDCLPVDAKILIAGCGTGSEAAQAALEYPDASVTAIDVSEASLSYARRQCAALGLHGIRFLNLDLHDVSTLKESFDAIFCSGVLHHLPDPERGWAALAAVLRAGGVMRIMLYSRTARLGIADARTLIEDLAARPADDDVLRAVRQRIMNRSDDPRVREILNASAFATLAGTHDLLLHRREDPFDIPRIARALERLRLRLISFVLPMPDIRARYDAMFPADRTHRSLQSWAAFERREPTAFISQYIFWCRSDAFWLQSGGVAR